MSSSIGQACLVRSYLEEVQDPCPPFLDFLLVLFILKFRTNLDFHFCEFVSVKVVGRTNFNVNC